MFKKNTAKEQKTSFKELSFGQKVEYIFGYYKYYMLALVIVIVTVATFINAYRRNDYTAECNIIVVDGKMTGYDDRSDYITQNFATYLGIDNNKHRVVCDYNYSLIQKDLDQESYVSQTKIYTLASTHSVDGYMASTDYIDYFSTDEETFLEDLREILTESELEKVKDYIIYYTKKDGTQIPIAVNLSDTKIKKDTDFTMDDPCYGVVVSAENRENAIAFIRFAFDL